ncbi:hypothetical protein [Bradyrhizobium sp. Tv2a-2]|uniref:hypothetical protein n=1 Tax=Bradyrhizobium sp. Tv2a-2 TaxID=113395 RepID=UPI0004645288|nr:hypothetical protein [Bradyrhizobium sp. Tv2a-2]
MEFIEPETGNPGKKRAAGPAAPDDFPSDAVEDINKKEEAVETVLGPRGVRWVLGQYHEGRSLSDISYWLSDLAHVDRDTATRLVKEVLLEQE